MVLSPNTRELCTCAPGEAAPGTHHIKPSALTSNLGSTSGNHLLFANRTPYSYSREYHGVLATHHKPAVSGPKAGNMQSEASLKEIAHRELETN